jgi:hypothetical protein
VTEALTPETPTEALSVNGESPAADPAESADTERPDELAARDESDADEDEDEEKWQDPEHAYTPDAAGKVCDDCGIPEAKHPKEWPHDWMEFHGDRLAVRGPKQSAISSYGMATSEGASAARRNKYSRLIIENHMSPGSYDRAMERFMDPDEEGWDDEAMSELVTQILEITLGPLPRPNRKQRRHRST